MLLDLHVHSKYSVDSVSKPEELVLKAAKKGFGFAITDHNNCDGWDDFKKFGKMYNVPIILGTEIKVFREKKLLGEVVGIFLKKPVITDDFFEAVELIHEQGGLVFAPHPFDLIRKPYFKAFDELLRYRKHFDAVEVFNSRTIVKKFDARAKKFAKENNMPMICGSDAHTVNELGNSLTEVKGNTLEQAKKEILAGRTRLHCHKSSLMVHSYSAMAKFGIAK